VPEKDALLTLSDPLVYEAGTVLGLRRLETQLCPAVVTAVVVVVRPPIDDSLEDELCAVRGTAEAATDRFWTIFRSRNVV
jgi:hypothetical protein